MENRKCGKCAYFLIGNFDEKTDPEKIEGKCYAHPPRPEVIAVKPSPLQGGTPIPIVVPLRPTVKTGTRACGDFKLSEYCEPVPGAPGPFLKGLVPVRTLDEEEGL